MINNNYYYKNNIKFRNYKPYNQFEFIELMSTTDRVFLRKKSTIADFIKNISVRQWNYNNYKSDKLFSYIPPLSTSFNTHYKLKNKKNKKNKIIEKYKIKKKNKIIGNKWNFIYNKLLKNSKNIIDWSYLFPKILEKL